MGRMTLTQPIWESYSSTRVMVQNGGAMVHVVEPEIVRHCLLVTRHDDRFSSGFTEDVQTQYKTYSVSRLMFKCNTVISSTTRDAYPYTEYVNGKKGSTIPRGSQNYGASSYGNNNYYVTAGFLGEPLISAINCPAYTDETKAIHYLDTGDDSEADNYDNLHPSQIDIYAEWNGLNLSSKWTEDGSSSDEPMLQRIHILIKNALGNDVYDESFYTGDGKYSCDINVPNVVGPLGQVANSNFAFVSYTAYNQEGVSMGTVACKVSWKYLLVLGESKITSAQDHSGSVYLHIGGEGDYDDIDDESTDNSDATLPDPTETVSNGFNKVYKMTLTNLVNLGQNLWNNSILDTITLLNNNPIENIVSLKKIPYTFPTSNETYINFGNVIFDGDTPVLGSLVTSVVSRKTVGSITPTISTKRGFLNFEPYTTAQLYLPMHGLINLHMRDIILGNGQPATITVEMSCDAIMGTFGYFVYTNKGGGKTLIYSCEGSCSIDIPVTSSNRSQVETQLLMSVAGATTSAVSGNVGGAIASVGNALTVQNHYTTCGVPNSMLSSESPNKCYLILRQPKTALPTNFAKTYGRKCMGTYKLSSLSGYTKIHPSVEIQIDGATQDEVAEIKEKLSSGVYL